MEKMVTKAIKETRGLRKSRKRTEASVEDCPQKLIGNSEAMVVLYSQMRQVAPTHATVLIIGETGTGKDLLAKMIHESSPRLGNLFVAVDCGALPETLLESELFGHKKGAYTGATTDEVGLLEEADGGTIFLDEIASASLSVQSKLLRFLQEGEIRRVGENEWRKVDVRVICATDRDLDGEVKEKRFRKDLYYRLKVFPLRLPPLRERRGDIPLLAEHFRKAYTGEYNKLVEGFEKDAMKALLKHPWEGNVRELQHVVERGMILCRGKQLCLEDLELPAPAERGKSTYREAIEAKRRELIGKAFKENNGNITRAAGILGMDRSQYRRLMRRFGIQSHQSRGRPKSKA